RGARHGRGGVRRAGVGHRAAFAAGTPRHAAAVHRAAGLRERHGDAGPGLVTRGNLRRAQLRRHLGRGRAGRERRARRRTRRRLAAAARPRFLFRGVLGARGRAGRRRRRGAAHEHGSRTKPRQWLGSGQPRPLKDTRHGATRPPRALYIDVGPWHASRTRGGGMHWLRHPVFTRFSLLCLLRTLLLGAAIGYAISALPTRAASEWEWQNTAALVRREVAREGFERIFADPRDMQARHRWGRALLMTLTTLPDVVRVEVWSRDTEILWSDERARIGQRFGDNPDLRGALAGNVEVDITRFERGEHRAPRSIARTLAEVYVPIFGRGGDVLGVVAVGKTPDRLLNAIRWSRLVIWAVSFAGGAMLYLVLLPLLMQVYRRQVEQEMLRQHAARLQEQVDHRTQQFMQAQK